MRLDLFLKCVCLAKSRSLASKAIEDGRVTLNGSAVKPSREVKPGDVLEMTSGNIFRVLKVLDVPKGQLSKAASRDLYEILNESRVTDRPW